MIIEFAVQNFGSIKDKQTLSFKADKDTHLEEHYIIEAAGGLRLLKLGLIYGANASGKTTILKALNFLWELVQYPMENKSKQFDLVPFLFDKHTPHENTLLSIEFISNKLRYCYEVELNKQAVVCEELSMYSSTKKAIVYKRSTDLENQYTHITFGSKIKADQVSKKILEANTLWNNTVLGGFLKTNIELKELKDATDWFKNRYTGIVLPHDDFRVLTDTLIQESDSLKHSVTQSLKKADLHITHISIKKEMEHDTLSDTYELAFEHTVEGEKYLLPFDFESQGTKRYYGLAGLLPILIHSPRVLVVDELESSLHPDLYIHFLLSFLTNAKNSQLIATTHNREILNNKDLFRNDAIWITDKGESCATELYSLADFDSSVIRDTTNIYNAYKMGKLGGVPHLGDYYIDTTQDDTTEE